MESKINEFARKQGYTKAVYVGKWRGFECYRPIIGDDSEQSFVGLPLKILVDENKNIRMSTPNEAMQQLRESNKR